MCEIKLPMKGKISSWGGGCCQFLNLESENSILLGKGVWPPWVGKQHTGYIRKIEFRALLRLTPGAPLYWDTG